MRHILRIDSRELTSGCQGEAIASVKLTSRVNRGEELCFGTVCPQMVEISLLELIDPIAEGEKLELFDEEGNLVGTFYCQNSEHSGAVTTITGYDCLYHLEKDLTQWLSGLDRWPYTLEDFAHMVCDACGVPLSDDPIPNGGYAIEKFTGNTTGRALMRFVGEAAGCFLQADREGTVHFRWYARRDVPEPVCLEKRLHKIVTVPVARVQIHTTAQDVGVFYPDVERGNTFQVTGNPLLTGKVLPIAQSLFEKLQGVSYAPGVLRVPECDLQVGDVFRFQGRDFYVMQTVRSAAGLELSCYGQERFGSVAARNQEKFTNLSGKVLELTAKVEGLVAENRDMAGNLARLSLDVEGISGQVVAQSGETAKISQSISRIDQKADSVSVSVSQLMQEGASRVETAFGVTLDGSSLTIARQGSEITNRLNENGMYVIRGEGLTEETVMLQADASGVAATDVTVRNYLRLGDHARFEDYSDGTDTNRTACFYC